MPTGGTDKPVVSSMSKNHHAETMVPKPEMSMKEFFDFFHTAYQLNQSGDGTEESESVVNQKLVEIDWSQLVQSRLVSRRTEAAGEDQNSAPAGGWWSAEQGAAKRQLQHVLQEGLLDSVLPYLVPRHCATPKPTPPAHEAKVRAASHHERPSRRRQTGNTHHQAVAADKNKHGSRSDVEVEIHVCDEVKGLRRTFRCPQRLLVSEMGYFAQVTAGQRLEDMDISVHCDVMNFEWLMQWVKRDQNLKESWPKLDCSNVVAVLTSAAFLQMELLLEACLHFCYTRANELLAGPANLACLNDSVLTRLAALFSNSEVEQLRDRKERLQARLYCKLIAALAQPGPAEEQRGHFANLTRAFRCSECRVLVPSRSLASRIPCVPSCTRVTRLGQLTHQHVRSTTWSLSEHVASLKSELHTWRRIYWRLWGQAHWLICARCEVPFPLAEALWCRVHAEPPHFASQRAYGRHPCCGLGVLRFTPLTHHSGCQFECHTPELTTEKEKAVWRVFLEHKGLIGMSPPSNRSQHGASDEAGEESWPWKGVGLEHPIPSGGLLPPNVWETSSLHHRPVRETSGAYMGMRGLISRVTPCEGAIAESSGSSTSASISVSGVGSDEDDEEPEADAEGEESQASRPLQAHIGLPPLPPPLPRHATGRHWDPCLTTRCNQDDQREFEERATRRLAIWLTCRCCTSPTSRSHTVPGGSFVALEREWRDTYLRGDKTFHSSGTLRHRTKSGRNNAVY